MSNQLTLRPGPEMLNGPILEGYSTLLLVEGMQVLLTCATQPILHELVHHLVNGGAASFAGSQWRGTHTRTAQPTWCENKTRSADLNDLFRDALNEAQPPRRRAVLR